MRTEDSSMSQKTTSGVSASTPAPGDQRNPAREARIDRWVEEALAAIAKPTPTEAFEALVAEHPGLRVEEWDASTLPEDLRDGYGCHYVEHKDGRRLLAVPAGQDPAVRLAAVRALLAHPAVAA
jgi:hypothetical protein